MITDAQLHAMAVQVANMAKTEIRYRHQLNGILASYYAGQGLHRLRKLEQLAVELCGEGWLNSASDKELIFGLMQIASGEIPPDAIVAATAVDEFLQTPAFDALPLEEKERIRSCDKHPGEMGGGLLIGQPDVRFADQSTFTGRLKFFGEPDPELVKSVEPVLREFRRARTN